MTTIIEIHGWKSDGPVYTATTAARGFRGRRRPPQLYAVGKRGGRNIESPAMDIIEVDGRVALFNKGYDYDVVLQIDGKMFDALVPATEDYAQFRLGPSVELISAEAVDHGASDDYSDEEE